jgi:hypothetical protein
LGRQGWQCGYLECFVELLGELGDYQTHLFSLRDVGLSSFQQDLSLRHEFGDALPVHLEPFLVLALLDATRSMQVLSQLPLLVFPDLFPLQIQASYKLLPLS